jgi:hypothetical protein
MSSPCRLARPWRYRRRGRSLRRASPIEPYRSFARTGKIGSETIGAIGVSGAPGGDKDEACANAGLAKISERLN